MIFFHILDFWLKVASFSTDFATNQSSDLALSSLSQVINGQKSSEQLFFGRYKSFLQKVHSTHD